MLHSQCIDRNVCYACMYIRIVRKHIIQDTCSPCKGLV
ncbi:hypothetical protein CSUI_005854 [Cystoisospora suis]|uniref:Uncharacterized protein n=1 Tax=Cystoisospora suis TaxID=483139 RepID=A0A2C6KW41_9APIC|nr:hypothetical protein CSUI_005854 [Cystoisospora suis]